MKTLHTFQTALINIVVILQLIVRNLLLVAIFIGGTSVVRVQPEARHEGLWLLPRSDARNSARGSLSGRMQTAPREVWRFGGTAPYRHVSKLLIDGVAHFLVPFMIMRASCFGRIQT